jgi:hypothetical protein
MFNPPSPRRSTATPLPPGYQPPIHPQSLQTTQTAPPLNAQPQAPPPPQPQPQPLQPHTQAPPQPNRAKREAPSGQLQRVIPPEEDMRRLFQECRIANGNAQLLNEALAFASPEDLREKDIIKVRVRISSSRSKGLMIYLGMVYEVPRFSGHACSANTMGDSRSGSIARCS